MWHTPLPEPLPEKDSSDPLKFHGFQWDGSKWTSVGGVNITFGLPIIRTSVDHGTAFGKAGKGLACGKSMIDAIKYALLLADYGALMIKKKGF